MPKKPLLNLQLIFERLQRHLSQSGPLKAKELCEFLDISQPAFSRLIQGRDSLFRMGRGNISFFCEGEKITGLAPAYDILPMMYAPQQNQLVDRKFDPSPPKSFETPVWEAVLTAAKDFWFQVQQHPEISANFKTLTSDNESKLSLPSSTLK